MHKDVITSFSNFVMGMEILRNALTQLLLYYTRLLDCCKVSRAGPKKRRMLPHRSTSNCNWRCDGMLVGMGDLDNEWRLSRYLSGRLVSLVSEHLRCDPLSQFILAP
jgi:hypothetical protein